MKPILPREEPKCSPTCSLWRFARQSFLSTTRLGGQFSVLIALLGGSAQPALGQSSSSVNTADSASARGTATTPKLTTVAVTDAVKQQMLAAVVRIDTQVVANAPSAQTLGAKRAGTGIVIGSNLILTIGYLVLEAESLTITTSASKRLPAVLAGYDHATGFGLIRTLAPLGIEPLALGDSAQVATLQKVLNLGHSEPEPTELDVVSRKAFAGSWEYLLEKPIYTAPAVNNWNGSALTTPDGKLIGVGSLVLADAADAPGTPGNLFVPIELLKPILNDLVQNGKRSGIGQPWFGMTTEWLDGNLYVVRIAANSPADQAQLRRGDKIIAVGGEVFTSQADFYRRAWAQAPTGKTLALSIERDQQQRGVNLVGIDRNQVIAKPQGV
jgi:serine protease Do